MIRKAKIIALLCLVHGAVCFAQTAPSLRLAWDASPSAAVSGYFVYTVDTANSQSVKTDVGNTTTAAINSLVPGHKYSIYATAYDASKRESGPSNVITFNVPNVAGSPSESSLTIDSRGEIWIRGTAGVTYGIQVSSDLKNWTEIGQVKATLNLVPFLDGAVAPGQTRFYRVAAK